MTTAFDFIRKILGAHRNEIAESWLAKKAYRSQSDRQTTIRLAKGRSVTPAYDARNAARRPLGAAVCGRVDDGVPGSRGPLLSSCGHGTHADVCVFAWMAGKCVS